MGWRDLQAPFPKMICSEMVECPRLTPWATAELEGYHVEYSAVVLLGGLESWRASLLYYYHAF